MKWGGSVGAGALLALGGAGVFLLALDLLVVVVAVLALAVFVLFFGLLFLFDGLLRRQAALLDIQRQAALPVAAYPCVAQAEAAELVGPLRRGQELAHDQPRARLHLARRLLRRRACFLRAGPRRLLHLPHGGGRGGGGGGLAGEVQLLRDPDFFGGGVCEEQPEALLLGEGIVGGVREGHHEAVPPPEGHPGAERDEVALLNLLLSLRLAGELDGEHRHHLEDGFHVVRLGTGEARRLREQHRPLRQVHVPKVLERVDLLRWRNRARNSEHYLILVCIIQINLGSDEQRFL